jgi:hypothetical protein
MSTHRVVMRSTLTGPDGAPVAHEAVDPRVPDDQIASFDAGRTWHPGEQVGQDTRWLLRGSAIPDDPARPAVEVALTVRPLVRGVDDPEVVVRDAPHVIVT